MWTIYAAGLWGDVKYNVSNVNFPIESIKYLKYLKKFMQVSEESTGWQRPTDDCRVGHLNFYFDKYHFEQYYFYKY